MKKAFKDLFGSFSIFTVLFIVSSMMVPGIDLIHIYLQGIGPSPLGKLEAGEIVEQTFAIGRGQKLTLNVQSNATFTLTVILGYSLEAYLKNPKPDIILYDDEGSVFTLERAFSNYSIINIFWNNSQSINTTMIINNNIHIVGLDLDLLTVSGLFLIVAVCCQLFTGIITLISDKRKYLFKKQKNNSFSFPSKYILNTVEDFPSYSRTFFLQLKKERLIFPFSILFSVLFTSFLSVNPSAKILIFDPTQRALAIRLIEEWSSSNQFFWILWVIVFALVGSGIWKMKQDTGELRNDLSLPFNRKLYAIVLSTFLILSCTLFSLVPYLVAILINYLRFTQAPDFSLIVIFLSLILTWQIVILLVSSTICLQYPQLSLFNIILIFLVVIFFLLILIEVAVPEMLLIPVPNKLDVLKDLLISNDLEIIDLFSLIGGIIVMCFGSFFLFIITIDQIQIE